MTARQSVSKKRKDVMNDLREKIIHHEFCPIGLEIDVSSDMQIILGVSRKKKTKHLHILLCSSLITAVSSHFIIEKDPLSCTTPSTIVDVTSKVPTQLHSTLAVFVGHAERLTMTESVHSCRRLLCLLLVDS